MILIVLHDHIVFGQPELIARKIVRKANDREIIYESHELMKIGSVYFSLRTQFRRK